MGSECGFENGLTYRILKDTDYENVLQFIKKNFIPFEPLCVCAKVVAEEETAFPHIVIKNALWQGVSIGVFDKENGALCAVRVNMLGKNNNLLPLVDDDEMHSHKQQEVFRMLKAIKKKDLQVVAGTANYMDHIFVVVSQSYTKRGIASELYRRSEQLAIEHGCKKLIATCSSLYTRLSTEKFGYELLNEIQFKDYVDELTGEKVFATMKHPHKSISLMIKTLPV